MTPSAPPPTTLAQAQAALAQREAELQQLQAAQEELLRAIAHDLRAPLRHITSFAPLLREALDSLQAGGAEAAEAGEEAREFLDTMEQSAQRMGRMLEGLSRLSRAARAPLQPEAVALQPLLEQSCLRLHASAPQQAVRWQLPEAGLALHADRAQLQLLLDELLGNAFKFTRSQADAQITVTAGMHSDGGCWLEVADNGVGFDPARAGALFQLFQRLHRAQDFEGEGTGLVLAQLIARRHGASLSLDGRLGQGCCARLQWPSAGLSQAG